MLDPHPLYDQVRAELEGGSPRRDKPIDHEGQPDTGEYEYDHLYPGGSDLLWYVIGWTAAAVLLIAGLVVIAR